MLRMRFVPAPGPVTIDHAPPPETGLPESVPAPAGRVPHHGIFATTYLWGWHPLERLSATALHPSTCQEPARSGVCIVAPRCIRPYTRATWPETNASTLVLQRKAI